MPFDKKLTKSSEAVLHLRSLFNNKTVSGAEEPKAVYAMSSLFQQHKLSNFRSCYNRMRKEYQSAGSNERAPVEFIEPSCSVLDTECNGQKRCFSALESDSEEDESSSLDSTVEVDAEVLKPAHLLAPWIEPRTLQKRLTVAVVLPAGTESGMFKCRVDPLIRKVFEISVVWPKPLVDVEIMHRKWLTSTGPDRIQAYHPKILAFQAALKELRRKCGDDVVSTAKIPLPFAVETHVYDEFNLGWRESATKMIYVELKASMDSYAHLNDDQDFEIV